MTTLVLLHGAPGDGTLWSPVTTALPGSVRAVTPTLRWFGPAPWPDDGAGFGTEAHTDQLIDLLSGLPEAPVAVAAWSYSAHVVLNALLRRPDLIARAFLYEPGLNTYLVGPEADAFNADAAAAFGPIAAALYQEGPESAIERLFEASGGPGCFAALSPGRRQRYLASAPMMRLLMGGGRPPAAITRQDLATIGVPTLVAMGARTRPLFAIAARAVANAIPDAALSIIEDADHMLPEVDPVRFSALLAEWLAG